MPAVFDNILIHHSDQSKRDVCIVAMEYSGAQVEASVLACAC